MQLPRAVEGRKPKLTGTASVSGVSFFHQAAGWGGQTIFQTANFFSFRAVLSGETGLRATSKFKNRLEGLCENRQLDPRNGLRFPFGFPHTYPVRFSFFNGPRRSKYGHTPSEIF